MSYFLQSGDDFTPTPGKESVLPDLPVGNYVVQSSMMSGMYYQRAPKFEAPGRLYGDIEARADRILNTFKDRPRATGALFAGEKGSGKSQLARLISIKGYDLGYPTILVNAPWHGDEFNNLLADVEQPAIVLMDEFEKVYNKAEQERVLTLLDGTMSTKKLFILTVNNMYAVDAHMRNRPGRLFYSLDFTGLGAAFIREYCEENLQDQQHVETIVNVSALFEEFNFDILKAVVEEMNRYGEDPFDVLTMLNAKPLSDSGYDVRYDLRVWDRNGIEVEPYTASVSETPITAGGEISVHVEVDGDDDGYDLHYVRQNDLTKLDASKGVYEFVDQDGYKFLYTRKPLTSFNMRSVL